MSRNCVIAMLLLVASLLPRATRAQEVLSFSRPVLGQDSPLPAGYGYVVAARQPCLDATARAAIQAELDANVQALRARGIVPATPTGQEPPLLGWPLAPGPYLHQPGFHGISNFVDQNPSYPNQLLDYECGARTYDTASGYNHAGIDYFLWPFSWVRMDHDAVQAVAAADGVIVGKFDGNFDRSCSLSGASWNAVYLQHADGSRTWYGHLKSGSLTKKTVGASVVEGEFLGVVGSSGNSTGVHLHLETYDALGHLVDPYAGPCNSLNASSWWRDQRDYYDSAINAVYTHDAPPEFLTCPQQALTHFRNQFAPGETFIIAAYYRDQRAGQVSSFVIRQPDGSLFSTWTHSMTVAHYNASYWYWSRGLPLDAPTGTWQAEVSYQGQTVIHEFTVGTGLGLGDVVDDPQPETAPARLVLEPNVPNPFNPRTSLSFVLADQGTVMLTVHDTAGRAVRQLVAGTYGPGRHTCAWDGTDDRGEALPSGVYYARLVAGQRLLSQKMLLLR